MSIFDQAIGDLFADPNLAEDALWHPRLGGEAVKVRVITRRPDQVIALGEGRGILASLVIEVRRTEVPSPDIGDVVEIGSERFKLIQDPVAADDLRLIWSCPAR